MNQQNNTFGHCVGQCSSAACIESKTQGHRARNGETLLRELTSWWEKKASRELVPNSWEEIGPKFNVSWTVAEEKWWSRKPWQTSES